MSDSQQGQQHPYGPPPSYAAPPPPPPYGSPPPYPPAPPPGYAPYPPQYGYAPTAYPRTSGLAIASFVLSLVACGIGSILAVIFGHVSMSQMKKDPLLKGRGFSIAGLVIGYIGLAFFVVLVLIAIADPNAFED